ncbi:MAG: hypothetical protein AB1782_09260 [Cyanobacteriota bacterium]
MSRISPIAFKGSIPNSVPRVQQGPRATGFLEYLGKNGNGVGLVTISTSLAVGLLRPLVMMFDKNATKEEKIHASAWIFALSMISVGVMKGIIGPYTNFANKLAKDLFKLKNKEAIQGAAECINFVLLNATFIATTYFNTRYVGKALDWISEKLTGKKFSKDADKKKSPDELKKEAKKDKMIFGALGALAVFIGLNVIGRKFGKGPIASDTVKKAFSSIGEFLSKKSTLFNNIKSSIATKKDQLAKWINRPGEKFASSGWFAKQTKVGDGWIIRNMIANTIVRPTIALLSGQPYVAFRCIIDEGVGAIIVKYAGGPIMKHAQPLVNKAFNVTPQTLGKLAPESAKLVQEGAKLTTGQLVRNIGILCIALGFFNNFMSSKMVKLMDKFKKDKGGTEAEKQYKDFRKQFIPAASLKEQRENIRAARNPEEWLMAINNGPLNSRNLTQNNFRQF